MPLCGGGPDLPDVLAYLGRPATYLFDTDAAALGRTLRAALLDPPGRLLVDLTGLTGSSDALRGLAGGLGVDLDAGPVALPAAPPGTDLVAVLPPAEASDRLLGVEGLAARVGYQAGEPVADVLRRDAALAALAEALGVSDAPGLGAVGGAALVIVALGGRLSTGFAECRDAAGLDATLARADLLVVGVDSVHIGNFGGPVLVDLAPLAAASGVPCVALARSVEIGPRELRRHGVEAAVALGEAAGQGSAGITTSAEPAARGWLA